jgi:hypothetical protein
MAMTPRCASGCRWVGLSVEMTTAEARMRKAARPRRALSVRSERR